MTPVPGSAAAPSSPRSVAAVEVTSGGTHRQPHAPSAARQRSRTHRSAGRDRHRRHPSNHPTASFSPYGGTTLGSSRRSSPGFVRKSGSRPGATAHASNNPLDTIGKHIPLPIPVPDWSKPIIVALLLLAIWFGIRSRLAALRARRLEGQRVTLLRDLGVMQTALVPEVPPRLGGLATSVAYRPAEGPAAGGDFYDLFIPEPGKVAIILGDVAGHGHEALTHAALTRYTLRAYIQAGLDPRAALALAGRALVDPAGERYATVAVGVYDTRGSQLTYALAGHPPPILRGFQAHEPSTICSSAPIGWGIPTGRRQSTVSLPAGAEVCFFSDGLIEARCEDGLLGRERLSEILDALGPRPAAADLLERVRASALATPDDMAACILGAQTTTRSACTHLEELEVDARALVGVQVQRFLQAYQVPAPEITQAIKLASEIVAAFTTALIRVELGPTGATATATALGFDTPPGISSRNELLSVV
jgi:Stage II sporulation protein E (SpoIIE)